VIKKGVGIVTKVVVGERDNDSIANSLWISGIGSPGIGMDYTHHCGGYVLPDTMILTNTLLGKNCKVEITTLRCHSCGKWFLTNEMYLALQSFVFNCKHA